MVLTGKPALAAFIVEVLGVAYSTLRDSSALTAILVRMVIVNTSNPSSRKKPLRAAISSGKVLRPAPVEAIFISSAALSREDESARRGKIETHTRNADDFFILACVVAVSDVRLATTLLSRSHGRRRTLRSGCR